MKRLWVRVVVAVVAVLALGAGAVLVAAWDFLHLREQRLDDHVVLYMEGGGNTLALQTAQGVVLVDTKFGPAAADLFERVGKLGPVKALINTHHHPDHTHGNPRAPVGTAVYAAAPVRDLLIRFDKDFWKDERARALMPNHDLTGESTLPFAEDTIRFVQSPPAHTMGDVFVLLEKRRLVHAGDVVVIGYYPNIDRAAGGSVPGMLQAVERLLGLPWDRCVPGHGPLATREDVERFRDFLAALWQHAQVEVAAGHDAAQAEKNAPESLRGKKGILGLTSLRKNLEWAMEEARQRK